MEEYKDIKERIVTFKKYLILKQKTIIISILHLQYQINLIH